MRERHRADQQQEQQGNDAAGQGLIAILLPGAFDGLRIGLGVCLLPEFFFDGTRFCLSADKFQSRRDYANQDSCQKEVIEPGIGIGQAVAQRG